MKKGYRYLSSKVRQWRSDRYQAFTLRRYGYAFYNWWRCEDPGTFWLYQFTQRPRLKQLSRSRRIRFISVFGDRGRLTATNCDLCIFFTGENLTRFPAYADHLLPEVDLALGFDSVDAGNYLRLPLWLLMCFPSHATLESIDSLLKEWQHLAADTGKRPPASASLVARHDDSGIRRMMAASFEKFGTVHYGGNFGGEAGSPAGPMWTDKLRYLRQYPFNICPENSDCPGYVTEKIFHAIASGCIPLYWGGGGAPEPGILNPEAIMHYDPRHPSDFEGRLKTLLAHPGAPAAFAQQPRFLPEAAALIYAFYLQLEDRLENLFRDTRTQ